MHSAVAISWALHHKLATISCDLNHWQIYGDSPCPNCNHSPCNTSMALTPDNELHKDHRPLDVPYRLAFKTPSNGLFSVIPADSTC